MAGNSVIDDRKIAPRCVGHLRISARAVVPVALAVLTWQETARADDHVMDFASPAARRDMPRQAVAKAAAFDYVPVQTLPWAMTFACVAAAMAARGFAALKHSAPKPAPRKA